MICTNILLISPIRGLQIAEIKKKSALMCCAVRCAKRLMDIALNPLHTIVY